MRLHFDLSKVNCMKKLLILGGSNYIVPVIQKAHAMGVYVITCDYLPENAGHRYADEYHNVSIVEKDDVLHLARKLQVDGISSFATDPGVVTAAYVAEHLGLPTPPYASVDILQHKDKFRHFLQKHGFHVPFSKGYESKDEALQDAEMLEYPVIVKPTDSAGSKGVTRVNRAEELPEAVNMAFQRSLGGRIIIEKFLEKVGCSSDTDCFSVDDALVFASFDNQYFDDGAANPYTPAAYSWPSGMPSEVQKELRSELDRLMHLLHMGTSIYNVETRLATDGKPYIMEVSPRGGGNCLSEMLERACGIDLITAHIRAALGMTVPFMQDPVYHGAWAEVILHGGQDGVFRRVQIAPELQPYVAEQNIWVHPGDVVHRFTGANAAIGTLVLKFPSAELSDAYMKKLRDVITVIIE